MSEIISHISDALEATRGLIERPGKELGYQLDSSAHTDTIRYAEKFLSDLQASIQDEALSHSVAEIVRRGSDGGQQLEAAHVTRDSSDQLNFRQKMASLKVYAPDTYNALRDNRVVGFHGTRSITLAGMLEQNGLLSAEQVIALGESGPLMTGGEHVWQKPAGQGRVSFSHVGKVKAAAQYADVGNVRARTAQETADHLASEAAELTAFAYSPTVKSPRLRAVLTAAADRMKTAQKEVLTNPDSLRTRLLCDDFPILVGVNGEHIARNTPVGKEQVEFNTGSYGEFRPSTDSLPLDALPVIAVPRDRMAVTQQLFATFDRHVTIVPIEDLLAA